MSETYAYCPQCGCNRSFTEVYRDRMKVTYRCTRCGYLGIVRDFKRQERDKRDKGRSK